MFELYGTGMKTQQLEEEEEEDEFVTYTVIQSITSSEMCALLLTHPRVHTPGAVDTHTHTHTHTHTPGAVDTHTNTYTHTHTHTHTSD